MKPPFLRGFLITVGFKRKILSTEFDNSVDHVE